MKEIKIDNEIFVLKEDIEKEYCVKSSETIQTFKIISKESMLLEESGVMGIGTVKLGHDFVVVKITTEYLEKAIKCLKQMSFSKKGLDSISIAWAKDQPAIIGRVSETGEMTGFVIAPKVTSE